MKWTLTTTFGKQACIWENQHPKETRPGTLSGIVGHLVPSAFFVILGLTCIVYPSWRSEYTFWEVESAQQGQIWPLEVYGPWGRRWGELKFWSIPSIALFGMYLVTFIFPLTYNVSSLLTSVISNRTRFEYTLIWTLTKPHQSTLQAHLRWFERTLITVSKA